MNIDNTNITNTNNNNNNNNSNSNSNNNKYSKTALTAKQSNIVDESNINSNSNNNTNDNNQLEILFLDTFSLANFDNEFNDPLNNNNIRKEPNIGLIQFRSPVIVDEIRIIPLSTVVSCENLRSVHLGATIPSSFDIHFYVNELKAKESSTFLDIGCFAYKEHGNHTFKSTKSVATDGLLICGYFQSVTIAVLGRITSLSSLKESTTAASATATEKLSSNDHSDDDNDLNSDDNQPKLPKQIVVDIKEPDDFNDKPQIDDQPNTADPSLYPRVDNDDDDDSDVHSLSSPSPSTTNVCARILSPSPSRTPPLPPQITQQSHSRIRNTKNDNDTIDSDIDDDDKSSKRYDFYRQRHRRSLSKSSSNQSPDSHVVNVKSRVLKPQSYDDDDDDGVDLNSSTNRHRISEPHQYRSDRYNDDNNDGSPSSPYGSRYYSSTSSASITSKDYYYHHHHHRLRSSPSTSKSTSSMKYRHNVLKYEHHHHYRSHSKDRDYDRDGHNDYDDRVYHSSYRSSSKNRRNQPNDYDDDDVGGDDGHGGGAGIIDHRKHYHHPKQHQYLHHQHRYDRRSISAERQNRESSLNRYGGHKHSYHQPNIKLKNQRNSSSHNDDNDDLDYTHRSSLSKLRTSTSGGSNSGHNIDSNNSDNNRDNISHVNNSPKSSSSSTTTPHKYRDYHHDNFQHRQQPKSCESRERSITPTTPPIVNYRNNKRDNDDRSSESRESSLMSDMQPPLRKKSKSTAVADADVEMIQSPCDDPDDDHSLSSPISTHNDKQVKIGNKMEIECIRSPGSPSDDDDDDSKNSEQILLKSTNIIDETAAAATGGGGGGQSPHSSISSNVSLEPFESCDQSKSKPIKSAETEEDDSKSGAKELFEPLSGSDIDDNDANNDDGNDNDLNFDDNFERISTSSDDDVGDFNETIDDSIANDDDHDDLKNKKTELEVISSDEEYPDNDNTTSSTLLQQSATTDNLNDNDNSNVECANINDDDDDDTIFLMTNNKMERNHRYNPMEANQLKILEFPLNNDTMKTSLMDWKIFNEIYKFLKDNFSHIYAINDGDNDTDNSHNKKRIDSIQNEWVKNVEILAMKIMKLKCPIYYEQFNETVKTDDHIDFNDDRNIKDFIRILISIINDGLDFNLAILQQQTPYKIRHIKAGIKLLISVFSSFDLRIAQSSMKFNDNGDLIEKLLNENFPYKLLKLYEIPYQSLSIRLLILNGLLVISDHLNGLKYICEQEFNWSLVKQYEDYNIHSIDDTPTDDTLKITNGTCYQYLLTLIMNNKQTRLTSIFEELLLKIHMFEVFDEFNRINIDHDNLTEINFAKIKSILLEICKYFRTISNRIHRPLRLMNNICQYEIKTTVNASIPLLLLSSSATSSTNSTDQNYDQLIENRFSCPQTNCTSSRIGYVATKLFYKFFEHFNILGKFIRLLSLYKVSMNKNEILAEICDQILHLFNAITLHQQGLKFLLANRLNVDQMNSLHSLLIDFGQPDLPENCEFVNFGLKLITRLRTFNLIDGILNNIYEYRLKQSLNNNESDTIVEPTRNSSVINTLLQLFMMIMYRNYQYRYEILQILTMEHNFDSIQSLIMPILQQFDQQNNKNSSNNIKRIQMDRRLDIVTLIYAIKLSIECIRYLPEKNLQHFIEIYGKSMVKTIEYCQRFIITDQSTNQTSSSTIKSYNNRTDSIIQYYLQKYSTLNDWLRPITNRNDSPSLSINNINNQMDELILSKFIGILKKCTDSFHEISQKFENQYERIYNLKPEVILSIKFLLTYCDPCIGEGRNLQPELQLKYKYSIVICYNCDCLQHLLSILTAIIETLERPSHAIYLRTKNDSYINLYCKNYSKLSSRNDSDNNNPDNSNQSNSTATTKFDRQQLQRYSDSIMNQGSLIMEFIRPSIRFLQLILDYLIESYGHNFKDSTPVPILLRLYNLLSLFMTNSQDNNTNQSMKSIQKQIIDIIGSIYTKIYKENQYISSDPSKSTAEMMNNVNKSVWTKMLKHVFEFTIKAPRYFQCGLEILSKILPSSLPLSNDKCSQDENYEKNYRKLWSLHLCCLNHEFEQLYEMFILSNNVNIQKLLRNVTYKLSDLSTTIVIENIMKKLLEILIRQISMIILDRKFKATINEQQNIDTIGNNLNTDNYNYVYNYNNLKKIFNFILDLYAKSLPFRIGLLNLIYCFITINSIDPMYKESKILKFFQQTYHYLNQRKFQQHNLIMVKKDLIVEILTSIDENLINGDNNDGENLIFYQYFANENEKLLQIMKNFQFSDKILQKFIHLCNETIGKYFEQRIVFIDDPNPDEEMFNDQTGDQEAMETVPIQAAIMNEIVFDERFIRMSKYFHLPEEWPSLSNVDQDNVTGLATIMNDKKKFDYQDLIKNYLKLEMDKFMRIIDTLYLPIIMQPESKNTENNSDPDGSLLKLNTANNNGLTSLNNSLSSMKRSTIRSGRGRGAYGHRGTDPFRSRPPNTSRPPSMHVDDFVAMEQRTSSSSSSIANIDGTSLMNNNKNRQNHLLLLSSSLSTTTAANNGSIITNNTLKHLSSSSSSIPASTISTTPASSSSSSMIDYNLRNNNSSSSSNKNLNLKSSQSSAAAATAASPYNLNK